MNPLEQRIEELEGKIEAMEKSDRFLIYKLMQIMDGRDIQLGRTTGTSIGTDTDQKVGFYGVTPVVQTAKISDPSGQTADLDNEARAKITAIIDALEAIGITASS